MTKTDVTEDTLYRELLKIGKNEKAIRPDLLLGYDALLHSPEVLRRAGQGAESALLAHHASEALRDAIDNIIVPLTRTMAEIALGANSDSEGLTVTERINNLTGFSEHQFKRHRRRAFESIVRYLKDEPVASRATAKSDNGAKEAERLLGQALTLHFASLACLFIWRYSIEPVPKPYSTGRLSHKEGYAYSSTPIPLPRYLFESYVALVYGDSLQSVADLAVSHLPTQTTRALLALYEILGEVGPIGPLHIGKDSRSIAALRKLAAGERKGDWDLRPPWELWYQWYRDGPWYKTLPNSFQSKNSEQKAALAASVRTMCAASGAIAKTVENFLPSATQHQTEAWRMALRWTVAFYQNEAIKPVTDLGSLETAVGGFFSRLSDNLTEQGLKDIIDHL